MSWIPGYLEWDVEEGGVLDVYGGDFGSGGPDPGDDGKWPKGPVGWVVFVLMLAAEAVLLHLVFSGHVF